MEYLNGLNSEQIKAVKQAQGPVLILAGAGSGKTTVLVNRISYILSELHESPYKILAITFTNKAANEMKERIRRKIGDVADSMWIGTFHSVCVKILRTCIDKIGYGRNFIIYDSQDSGSIIKECIKELELDDKKWSYRGVANIISRAKDELMTPEIFRKVYGNDFRMRIVADIYDKYQKKLISNNALDFDDIIVNTVRVLTENPQIRENYGLRFKYIMVDEYQDTNNAQYTLISLLAREHRNLCVVGDDDQSIYKFRGANIRNILDFEKEFSDVVTIKLEQNYRSTKNILGAANAVIANNRERKGKNLWTEHDVGDKIVYARTDTEHSEADFIAKNIKKGLDEGYKYSDFAVLYRMNAQSRVIEKSLERNNIPYRVLAGLRFYDRKEIKDVLAYLRVVYNFSDDVSVKRIINVPKRGIGQSSIDKISRTAEREGVSFFSVLENIEKYPELLRIKPKTDAFVKLIKELENIYETEGMYELVCSLVDMSGYMTMVTELDMQEKTTKKENVEELVSAVKEYCDDEEIESSLADFLERTALIADVDNYDPDADAVVLMTMHSAKGLEFPVVFLPGFEAEIFPGKNSVGDEEAIEEERRLCYVAITRAKEKLYISGAENRMVFGQTQYTRPSMFISEIPDEYLDRTMHSNKESVASFFKSIEKKAAEPKVSWPTFSQAKKPSGKAEKFLPGERVRHPKFGDGTVISAQVFGDDAKLEISFDEGPPKILMAKFAKIIHI